MVDLQPLAHRVLTVVVPLVQLPTAHVAHALRLRRGVVDVEDVAAVLAAHAAAGDAPDHLVLGDLQVQHGVQRQADVGEDAVERLGLREVAREAVEQEAVRGVRLLHAVLGHADGDLVRHQLALAHEVLRAAAQLRALADVGTEEVTGGDVRNAEILGEQRGLRALARTRRPDEEDTHQRRNPS
ncbi:hypothetical protein GCM10023347_26270 [Streptomyces chumphonensis]